MASINQIIDILTKIGFFSLAGWGVREWFMYMRKQKELKVKQHQADKKAQAAVLKKMNDKDILLQNGVIAMLHHETYDNCTRYLETGYITTGQLNDLNYLFDSYKARGSNTSADVVMTVITTWILVQVIEPVIKRTELIPILAAVVGGLVGWVIAVNNPGSVMINDVVLGVVA